MYEEYPPRLTCGGDGIYRWRGRPDEKHNAFVVKVTMLSSAGLCLLMLGLVLLAGGGEMLPAMLLTCVIIMAIAGAVCLAYRRISRNASQPYEISDEYVRHVGSTPRYDTRVPYKNIRRLKVRSSRDQIVVKTRGMTMPVFVPHEDFHYVLDYIRCRIPADAEVIFEE